MPSAQRELQKGYCVDVRVLPKHFDEPHRTLELTLSCIAVRIRSWSGLPTNPTNTFCEGLGQPRDLVSNILLFILTSVSTYECRFILAKTILSFSVGNLFQHRIRQR